MPIYAYKCESCGHRQDVLQKISDPALEICPACHAPRFVKQVTAAGFQLKGSGWYVTDFRGGSSNGDKPKAADPADGKSVDGESGTAAPTPAPAKGTDAGAPAAAPAAAEKPRPPTPDAA